MLRAFASILSFLILAHQSVAQEYPARPVSIVLPFPGGGGLDFIGRLLADDFTRQLGEPFIIDNRSGAGGTIGTAFVANANADGYTLLFNVNPPLTMNPFLQSNVSYNIKTSFTPIGLVAEGFVLVAVNPSMPFLTIQEMVAYAKKYPGTLNFGTPGVGTGNHVVMELLKQATGIDIVHVPYRGTAAAVQDTLSGDLQIVVATAPAVVPLAQAGKLRIIASVEPTRFPEYPDVPTLNEVYPGARYHSWYALYGPAGLTKAIRDRLSRALIEAVGKRDFAAKLKDQGLFAKSSTPEELNELGRGEFDYYSAILPKLGLNKSAEQR